MAGLYSKREPTKGVVGKNERKKRLNMGRGSPSEKQRRKTGEDRMKEEASYKIRVGEEDAEDSGERRRGAKV